MADELGGFIPYLGGVELAHMKESDVVDWFIPLVKRLSAGEWFTAQVSTYGLFHIAYPGKHTLLTRMSVCVAETSRLSVPRGPPRICAGNRDAAATGLGQASSLDGLEPPWVQLAPPRFFPQ
ncbi:unnamed protein product [Sphagnum jensenii]|uniref:Uncharacterized protein n=1 Tax=Sphagnum jensenii TaxID=128206 RepID=A0ABP0W0A8_9BRYO